MSSFFYSMNLESSLINELLLNCFLCMFFQKPNYDSIIGRSEHINRFLCIDKQISFPIRNCSYKDARYRH